MASLKVASITEQSFTAGLSTPELKNARIEIFLAGCRMAREGHPCPGCFNSMLWDDSFAAEESVNVVFEKIAKIVKNTNCPYVTIVGGEPLDQYEGVVGLINLLAIHGCHVCLITHYTLEGVQQRFPYVLGSLNLLIDGKYDASCRIFDEEKKPGIYQVVGSRNQRIWWHGFGRDKFTDVTDKKNLQHYYQY